MKKTFGREETISDLQTKILFCSNDTFCSNDKNEKTVGIREIASDSKDNILFCQMILFIK